MAYPIFFITPHLYSKAKKSFVRNLSYVGYINVQDNLLQTFRQILNNNEININRLYEFNLSVVKRQQSQFKNRILFPQILNLRLNQTVLDEVKIFF